MIETLILALAAAISVAIVVLIWYLRFRQNKSVVERVRRSPEQYLGSVARGVYTIHLPSNRIYVGYATPPPTFSKAVKCPFPPSLSNRPSPSPSFLVVELEQPPPNYAQAIILAQQRPKLIMGPGQGQRMRLSPAQNCFVDKTHM